MPRKYNSLFNLEQGMYNPNDIVRTPSAGIGSGNPVQSAQQKQQNMSQSMSYSDDEWGIGGGTFDAGFTGSLGGAFDEGYGGMNVADPYEETTTPTSTSLFNPEMSQGGLSPLELLQGYFPDIDDDILSQYSQFVSPLPDELYEATLEDAPIYEQMRTEQTGFLQDQRKMGRKRASDALFSGYETARGMAGKRGMGIGRDLFRDISREASYAGDEVNRLYARGVYDINQNIVDRIGAARMNYATLLGQQRGDVLKIAELADMFQLPEVT